MKITGFQVYQFSLPLKQPFAMKDEEISQRDGLILELTNEEGIKGFGEISPLPGLSPETLTRARTQILSLEKSFLNQEVPHHLHQLNGHFDTWMKRLQLHPSVRFGIEMAVLNLLANSKHSSFSKLVNGHHHHEDKVLINGLLQGTKEQIIKDAQNMVTQGYRTIKLKVGSSKIEEDIEKVQAVNEIIENKAILRVDANQKWDYEQAVTFAEKVGPAAVEYIEEPFAAIDKIPEFYTNTLIPVALDESLQTLNFSNIKSIEGVDVLIIKPTVLGGIERAWQLMEQARQVALQPVVSSTFETSMATIVLATLGEHHAHHIPTGLDTMNWFNQQLLLHNPTVKNGYLDFHDSAIHADNINFDLLTKISK
jgi:o-succinylbenzoate synthase